MAQCFLIIWMERDPDFWPPPHIMVDSGTEFWSTVSTWGRYCRKGFCSWYTFYVWGWHFACAGLLLRGKVPPAHGKIESGHENGLELVRFPENGVRRRENGVRRRENGVRRRVLLGVGSVCRGPPETQLFGKPSPPGDTFQTATFVRSVHLCGAGVTSFSLLHNSPSCPAKKIFWSAPPPQRAKGPILPWGHFPRT